MTLVNQTISHYRIVSQLGAGGMGEVYLAEDTQLGRRVAIKFLSPELVADERANKRLFKEARAAATLDHPNICSIYEVGEADGRSFIAMQYIEGETLDARIKGKPLELKDSLSIASQVADGLAEAHAHGIIHRDIKPANIMITARGQVKVMDFGLAKLIQHSEVVQSEAETEALLSTPGAIIGTVPYMSPEQVRGQPVDARSDIFSFGVLLYEILSGQQPFVAESATATASAILTREPPPLARYSSDVPGELQRIVRKCMEKDRERRYQTARDLAIDLHNLARIGDSAIEAVAQSLVAPGHSVRSAVVAVLAFALIAAVAIGIYYSPRSGHTINSIAVLPFANIGGNPDVEYLSDGITESLIDSLSQLPNLKVMSRNSVFHYKGREIDARHVGRELNVQAVLTGRVVQRSDGLSISIELVDARDSTHLWGEQYNRKLTDILQVQDEITNEITGKLQPRLSGEEKKRLTKRYTENAEAYQLYLKGRYAWNKRSEEWVKKGIAYFNQAIEVDRNYALAFAGLADSYNVLGILDYLPAKEAYPKARAAAAKALEIDDALAEAHTSLARVKQDYEWDWRGAEQEYKRAIALNSNYPTAHHWFDILLSVMGRHAEALAEAKRAQELDPLSIIINSNIGWVLFNMGQVDQAIEQERKALELDPNFVFALDRLARFYEFKGMYGEAVANYLKARTLSGAGPEAVAALKEAYAASGIKGYWRRRVQQLKIQAQQGYVSRYSIAEAHVRLGEKDQALEWLKRGYEEHENIAYLKVDPMLGSLRLDPRFQDLLRRAGFAP
jgi:serine/threonine protein kinase/tetratricopeptide (TPR) repeat protein